MQAILRDIRYGIRSLAKNPAMALVATLALTLGIGLTATMYSIIYGALMKGLPFDEGDRIVQMVRHNPLTNSRNMGSPITDYVDYRDAQKSLANLGAYYAGTVNVSGDVEAERFTGAWVTASTFELARVRPLLGRYFQAGEDTPSGPRVAVLGHGIWQRRFGGDSAIVGKALRANGVPYTIIGVMPEGFRFPDDAALWLPLQLDPLAIKRGQGQWLTVVGRLKEGVTIEEATADVNAIAQRLAKEYKETNENIGASVAGYVDAEMGPEPRQLLYTMLGAVFFVLLIACANVANLLLDRAAHKSKEIGIRTALGATRGAVVRQFLTEAFVLSAGRWCVGHRRGMARHHALQPRHRRHAAAVLHRHRAASAGAAVRGAGVAWRDDVRRHHPGVPVLARGPQRDPEGRDARFIEPQDRQGEQGPRGVRDRALVRIARGFRPDDQVGHEAQDDGPGLPHGEHLHGARRFPGDVHGHRDAEALP